MGNLRPPVTFPVNSNSSSYGHRSGPRVSHIPVPRPVLLLGDCSFRPPHKADQVRVREAK